MDETVTHYITSHPADEAVHVDGNALALNVQDDGGGRVAIMHSQTFSTSLCRQVSVGDQVAEGQWGEELMDPEGRLAALMAHITSQQSRGQPQMHHKIHTVRGDVDSSIILDSSMRLFHGPPMDQSQDAIVVDIGHLPPLPPLQDMKRCPETDWFSNKTKPPLKDDSSMVESDGPVLELGPGASPAQHKHQSKKSLPHKKRISRKLKKNNGNSTPQQELVVISCSDVDSRMGLAAPGSEQEILPDTFAPHHAHHITHEVRPIYICQLCGEFYGEEQLKFYQHLKQHYEPHIIIENPVPDLGIDKMSNTCIVDNVTTIPDSIVELSLENTIPKTMYQTIDKHVLYTTSDKTYTYPNNKVQYSMASMDKEPPTVVQEVEKTDLYDSLDKLDLYSCGKCNKSFRKQKQCEAHIKEVHSNMKLEDMGEFSEPEDLMEGIHVAVDEPHESHVPHDSHVPHESHVPHDSHDAHESHAQHQQYEHTLLPHLTVENGHAHQENVRHWYGRGPSAAPPGGAAPPGAVCCAAPHDTQHLKMLKANSQYEILRRILETDVSTNNQNFADNIIPDNADNIITENPDNMMSDNADTSDLPNDNPPPDDTPASDVKPDVEKKKSKHFECPECPRVFQHRNSLLYHLLSHSGKQHMCRECGKGFYTVAALKIHKRVHNGDRPYKCDVCGRDFRQWSDVKYHKISIHSDQCDKSFRVGGDLRRHMLIHDKVRNRITDQKTKPKDKDDKKPIDKADDKPNIKIESSKIKKIALASTTKGPIILRSSEKKTKPNKKNHNPKKGAPNVTIDQLDESYTNNVEVFDTRQDGHYGKLVSAKEEYSECNYKEDLENPFAKQVIEYKEEQSHERELAILRPMFRNNVLCDQTVTEPDHTVFRQENTDGKMQVYTHIEKGNIIVPNSQMSLGHLERDVRTEMHETTENGFIERLTALYNIPAV
ncbi:hypothetical protein B5X24_HaOG216883 [Helicoverpa armigera]|uniref:C2H2-type domain-containing protein n=1 Tax=Helicoverpa armigera TaxID=29058 RepID=A0A2W1BVI4_HELAM|nr:hypothetical protein B5X24_HaOG216883 [Helicoverpa armigera]